MFLQDSEPSEPDELAGERVIALRRATLRAVDFRKARFDRFALTGCLFERCDFRGIRADHRYQPLFAAQPRSVFLDCRFDGADLRRVRPAWSRFERCTFDDARIEGWRTEVAEFVGCRFAGPLDGVTFYGRPAGAGAWRLDSPRRRNEFRGNDFRDAELIDAAFVKGIEMDAQRWPDDEYHVRVDRFPRRIARARAEIRNWYERDRGPALLMLAALAARWPGQETVVAPRTTPRMPAPPRVQGRVWALLERVAP